MRKCWIILLLHNHYHGKHITIWFTTSNENKAYLVLITNTEFSNQVNKFFDEKLLSFLIATDSREIRKITLMRKKKKWKCLKSHFFWKNCYFKAGKTVMVQIWIQKFNGFHFLWRVGNNFLFPRETGAVPLGNKKLLPTLQFLWIIPQEGSINNEISQNLFM